MRILAVLCSVMAGIALASHAAALKLVEPSSAGQAALTSGAPISLLIDADTGQVLHSVDPHRRFIPASMTKIMSAYVAFELIAAGKLKAGQSFRFTEAAASEWQKTGSTMFLEAGDTVTVDDLLRAITSVSANDASIVLAEGAAGSVAGWVKLMNDTARSLEMRNSHFGTPNGWPDGGQTFTTAHDLALLSRALIERHPELYARYFGKDGMRYNGYAQANHDPISGIVDGADGIKTGFTNQAGNSFTGSAKRGDTRLIMVLAGIEDEARRAEISRDLIEWGFRAFDRQPVFKAGQMVGQARVQDGVRRSVTLLAPEDIRMAIPDGRQSAFTYTIRYQGPIKAPVKKASAIAELSVKDGNTVVAQIPLVAANDVAQAGMLRRVFNAFEGWIS